MLVDTPQSLVAMARVGVGVGIANAVALAHTDTAGLVVLDIDDPDLVREVAAYWYDVLASTAVGASLLRTLRRGAGAGRGDRAAGRARIRRDAAAADSPAGRR